MIYNIYTYTASKGGRIIYRLSVDTFLLFFYPVIVLYTRPLTLFPIFFFSSLSLFLSLSFSLFPVPGPTHFSLYGKYSGNIEYNFFYFFFKPYKFDVSRIKFMAFERLFSSLFRVRRRRIGLHNRFSVIIISTVIFRPLSLSYTILYYKIITV